MNFVLYELSLVINDQFYLTVFRMMGKTNIGQF